MGSTSNCNSPAHRLAISSRPAGQVPARDKATTAQRSGIATPGSSIENAAIRHLTTSERRCAVHFCSLSEFSQSECPN